MQGIFFTSLILVVLMEGIGRWEALCPWGLIGVLFLCVLIYFVGREAVKLHYRSRAIRLYVNFLMLDDDRILELVARKDSPAAKPGGN